MNTWDPKYNLFGLNSMQLKTYIYKNIIIQYKNTKMILVRLFRHKSGQTAAKRFRSLKSNSVLKLIWNG